MAPSLGLDVSANEQSRRRQQPKPCRISSTSLGLRDLAGLITYSLRGFRKLDFRGVLLPRHLSMSQRPMT